MKIDRLFAGMNIGALGLSAQRKRMNAIAENIANTETTRTESGEPYRRKIVHMGITGPRTFPEQLKMASLPMESTNDSHITTDEFTFTEEQSAPQGVEASEVEDSSAFRMVYDPAHPDADENGYVKMPNINIVTEMVDMISASRAYEANVTTINAEKTIAKDSLEI